LRGNSITFVPDDHGRRTETGYFRLEKESTDGAKNLGRKSVHTANERGRRRAIQGALPKTITFRS